MFEFRQAERISRPPEDVFALLTRFEDIPKFVPQVASAEQTSPGEVSVGTIFVQRGRFLGRTFETSTVVTSHEPPSRFGYRVDQGPVPYEAPYDFTPSDGGTLLEAAVAVRLRGAARALEPFVGRFVRRAYANNRRSSSALSRPPATRSSPRSRDSSKRGFTDLVADQAARKPGCWATRVMQGGMRERIATAPFAS